MMGSNRSDAIPGLATIAEQGFPGYAFESYIGISGPTGMPAGAVKQLNEAFAKVVKMPDVVKQLDAQGSVPVGSTPGEFSKLIQAESERWKKVVRVVARDASLVRTTLTVFSWSVTEGLVGPGAPSREKTEGPVWSKYPSARILPLFLLFSFPSATQYVKRTLLISSQAGY